MSLFRIASLGCLLLTGIIAGCGDGSNSGEQVPIASDQPDAGLEASNSLKQMQPPPSPGKKARK